METNSTIATIGVQVCFKCLYWFFVCNNLQIPGVVFDSLVLNRMFDHPVKKLLWSHSRASRIHFQIGIVSMP